MTDAEMNPEPLPPGEPQGDNSPTASEMLSQARESRGLTQAQVADRLYLSTTFIRYIDEGNFEKLPKPAFIKGYLRSYARIVSLDADVVVAAYDRAQNVAPQDPEIGYVTEEAVGSGSFTGPVVQTGIISLVVVVLVAALVWWFASGKQTSNPAEAEDVTELSQTPSAQLPDRIPPPELKSGEDTEASDATNSPDEASAGTVPEEAMPANETGATQSDAGSATPAATDVAAETPQDDSAPTTDNAVDASDVQIDRVKDGDTQYITVNAGGQDKMEFAFTDECWVEISDGHGERIYGDLNRAGDVMTVLGVAPFEVLLGRAPAVSMTYQGKTVDLSRYTTRDETAKVRTARL